MRWFRKPSGDPLTVSMSGLKLGDRLLMLGSSDPPLAAALASKVGLTGRACLLDDAADRLRAAAAAVEQEGALVESFASPMSSLHRKCCGTVVDTRQVGNSELGINKRDGNGWLPGRRFRQIRTEIIFAAG